MFGIRVERFRDWLECSLVGWNLFSKSILIKEIWEQSEQMEIENKLVEKWIGHRER